LRATKPFQYVRRHFLQLGSSQSAAFRFHKWIMLFPSRFSYRSKRKRRAGAVCRAGRKRFCAPISTDVVRPQLRKERIRRSVIPSPAHEPRVGSGITAQTAGKKTSAPWPERVSSLISTDGRQPFVPAASRKASLLRAYPSVPLFSRRNGRSSALIGAPPSSDLGNVTRTMAACQDNSQVGSGSV
jgi:hypothetical protein